ncbi:hypothetical protein L7F22_005107 [Adiantum nelumboides]|nr:hypothetical protein [Adiantum nelumboides]
MASEKDLSPRSAKNAIDLWLCFNLAVWPRCSEKTNEAYEALETFHDATQVKLQLRADVKKKYGLGQDFGLSESSTQEGSIDVWNVAAHPVSILMFMGHNQALEDQELESPFPKPSRLSRRSFLEFISHDFNDANNLECSGFFIAVVHRIGILDIKIFSTDRHARNILVKKMDMLGTWGSSCMYVNNNLELVPIDHGRCLPEFLEGPYFEWLHWPQASLAFSNEELDYIRRLDAKKDGDRL